MTAGWALPPTGREVLLRSLDFWRIEGGLIRENWVLVDLLDLYAQIGVDVLARLREFNKARIPGPIQLPDGLTRMTLPRTPSFRLDNRRALVAGASSGIGAACAVALAEAGAEVTLAARSARQAGGDCRRDGARGPCGAGAGAGSGRRGRQRGGRGGQRPLRRAGQFHRTRPPQPRARHHRGGFRPGLRPQPARAPISSPARWRAG